MDNKELNELLKELEDLQIQQEAVVKKIRQASTEEAPQPKRADQSARSQSAAEDPFQVGQKVLIKNRLGQILGRTPSIKDRVGTVVKITKKRIHIKTINGSDTSRAPHNVTRLTQEEYEGIVTS